MAAGRLIKRVQDVAKIADRIAQSVQLAHAAVAHVLHNFAIRIDVTRHVAEVVVQLDVEVGVYDLVQLTRQAVESLRVAVVHVRVSATKAGQVGLRITSGLVDDALLAGAVLAKAANVVERHLDAANGAGIRVVVLRVGQHGAQVLLCCVEVAVDRVAVVVPELRVEAVHKGVGLVG